MSARVRRRPVEVHGAVWNGPDLLGVLLRKARNDLDPEDVFERWESAPAVWADDQWLVSYVAYCRVRSYRAEAPQTCPPDPRPELAAAVGANVRARGMYDPDDLPDEERFRVNRHVTW